MFLNSLFFTIKFIITNTLHIISIPNSVQNFSTSAPLQMSDLETYYFMSHFPCSMTMNSWEMAFNHSPNAAHFFLLLLTTVGKPLTFFCDGIQSKYIALAIIHTIHYKRNIFIFSYSI